MTTPTISLRVLIVLAAVFLVGAVALGSVLPADEPLSQVIADLDGSWIARVQAFELRHLGFWLWEWVTVPILLRPSWFVPFGIGLVFVGAATTLSWRQTPRGRRFRP